MSSEPVKYSDNVLKKILNRKIPYNDIIDLALQYLRDCDILITDRRLRPQGWHDVIPSMIAATGNLKHIDELLERGFPLDTEFFVRIMLGIIPSTVHASERTNVLRGIFYLIILGAPYEINGRIGAYLQNKQAELVNALAGIYVQYGFNGFIDNLPPIINYLNAHGIPADLDDLKNEESILYAALKQGIKRGSAIRRGPVVMAYRKRILNGLATATRTHSKTPSRNTRKSKK